MYGGNTVNFKRDAYLFPGRLRSISVMNSMRIMKCLGSHLHVKLWGRILRCIALSIHAGAFSTGIESTMTACLDWEVGYMCIVKVFLLPCTEKLFFYLLLMVE